MTALYTWPDLTARLLNREDLSTEETSWAMAQVMSGSASDIALAGFLAALATKGETIDELRGFADTMLDFARPISIDGRVVDIVGTGGDRLHTVNISTTAALVIAAAGVPVVKHGNRASSSSSGAADCLEALGINISMPVEHVGRVFDALGITFCFANLFHPSMRYAAPVRKALAVPTVFNLLGPLTNPARPASSAIGVSNKSRAPIVAGVLADRGSSSLVFRGDNGMDELSAVAVNTVWEVRDGAVAEHRIDAVEELGLPAATVKDLLGGDAQYNAEVVRQVFDGAEGHVANAVCLNAAAAFVADGRLVDPQSGTLVERLREGIRIARETIASGAPRELVANWAQLTNSLG